VKVRGYRIEPGEIEAHLAAHPGVRAAVVVARQLRPGDVRLVGYFVPQAQVPTVSQLQALLRQRLPEYMVPSSWVALEQLPLTPSGKVDRKALPLPDMPGSEPTREYMAPRTPAEQQIAAIWSEVLGHDRIGVHDNFFELGGHSLLATRVATRLQQTFDVDILLRRIFEAPTVAALAVVVEAAIEAQISQLSDAEAEVMLSRMEKL